MPKRENEIREPFSIHEFTQLNLTAMVMAIANDMTDAEKDAVTDMMEKIAAINEGKTNKVVISALAVHIIEILKEYQTFKQSCN